MLVNCRKKLLTKFTVLIVVFSLVVAAAAGTVACSPFPGNWPSEGEVDRNFLYPVIAISVVLVIIAAAASDVDTAEVADSKVHWNCSVANRTNQSFLMYSDNCLLGRIEPNKAGRYLLDEGRHALEWQPLEYGFDYYDLHHTIVVTNQRCCWEITLDEVD